MAPNLESSFERCCRLCAEEQDVTVMIFSDEAEAMLLQNKLNQYLLIEVDEDDRLPKHVCIQCCTNLQKVCDFIDTARKAQDVLLSRILMLDDISQVTNQYVKVKSEPFSEDDAEIRVTEMEVSVDPMMVLQNSEEASSPTPENNFELASDDVTYLHGVDGENVTIKLIKRGDKSVADGDDKKDPLNKPFPCETCKRSFYSELALKNHSWIHIGETKNTKLYRCNTCEEGYDYKCDLIAHLKVHRTSGMCQLCGRVFRTEKNLAAHMAMHLSTNNTFTCNICGRSYNTMSNLKTHGITHSNERPYKCQLCKKSFKRNQDLKFHINQHTGHKPYKCPFCEKSFASSGNCYSHRSRMHPGRRVEFRRRVPHYTENQEFQQLAILPKPTLAAVRGGIYKYQCHLCDHSFMKRDNYTYHMYQHTGEKPFQCSLCTDKFVTRRGLLIHHDKEHPGKDRPLALLSRNALLK